MAKKNGNLRRYPTHHSCPGDEQDPRDVMRLRGYSQYFLEAQPYFSLRSNRDVQGFAAVSGRKRSNPEVEQQKFAAARFANPLLVQIFSDWIPFPEIPRLKGEIQQPSPSHRQIHEPGA